MCGGESGVTWSVRCKVTMQSGGGVSVCGGVIMGCLPPDLFVCMRAGCSERETATSCATQDNIRKKIRITLQNLLIYT